MPISNPLPLPAAPTLRQSLACMTLLMSLSILAACAAPAPDTAAQASTAAMAAQTDASNQDAPRRAPPMSDPLPPTRMPAPPAGPAKGDVDRSADAPVKIDFSCTTDADCAVKNVGNCCGYYPKCVNRDSPTDPQAVQAQCAKSGMASVCGFPAISSCQCVQGSCEGSSAALIPQS